MIPSIEPPTSHNSQQSTQPTQQPSTQAAPSLPGQVGLQDQTGPSQVQAPPRKQYQNQPAMPSSSAGAPSINVQSQPMPSRPLQNPQQPKGNLYPQMNPTSLPQSSQLPNMPAHPLHSSSQIPSLHQTQMSAASGQLQQSNNQAGSSMQVDRGSWMSGPPESSTVPLPGGGQPPHPPPLSPEMEKVLHQQVMTLTPEQINLLPPEQKSPVLLLQQILRQ
ncbi:unnamed protein product [Malus baccata var. baccata]